MENELIARYIYAVVRHLPQKMRADVEKELDSMIADMLAERCGDVLPADKDVKAVLTGLGTPEELAMKYSGDENQALISGINFLYYKLILKIVLPIVVVCVTVGNIVSLCLDPDRTLSPLAMFGMTAGQIFSGIIGGLVFPFAIITFIFAVFERYKVRLDEGDMFSRLPAVPRGAEKLKPSESIAGMIFAVAAAVVFLGFPEVLGMWHAEAGWTPIFVPSVLRGLWAFIVLWAAIGIVKESAKLIEGQYTKRLALINIICNIFILACAAVVFLNNKIINPEFLSRINGMIAEDDGQAAASIFFGNINLIIIGAVLLGLVIDSVTVAINGWKSGK